MPSILLQNTELALQIALASEHLMQPFQISLADLAVRFQQGPQPSPIKVTIVPLDSITVQTNKIDFTRLTKGTPPSILEMAVAVAILPVRNFSHRSRRVIRVTTALVMSSTNAQVFFL